MKRKSNPDPRLLAERPVPQDGRNRGAANSGERLVRSVTVNLSESPLGWLHARGHLTDRQLDGGEQLRRDWELAQLGPQITMSWDFSRRAQRRHDGSDRMTASDRQLLARRRFEEALDHLGTDLADIAWRIICAGEGVPAAEKTMGWPARSGKLVLKIALDRLADHYRLP